MSLFEHYQNGRFGDAEKLAISITQEFPRHQFSWKMLGVVLEQTGISAMGLLQVEYIKTTYQDHSVDIVNSRI